MHYTTNRLKPGMIIMTSKRGFIKTTKIIIGVESDELYDDKYQTSEWKKKIPLKNLR